MILERRLWGAQAAWWMGLISIPMAFAGPLVVPALILGVIAVVIGRVGMHHAVRQRMRYEDKSVRHARQATWTGAAGVLLSATVWLFYALRVVP